MNINVEHQPNCRAVAHVRVPADQVGKGGGLAGAFGGVGGSSPFGSKAGDTFTRFTIYVAAAWILLIMVQVRVMSPSTDGPINLPGASGNP